MSSVLDTVYSNQLKINNLPNELLLHVVRYLDLENRKALSLVSSRWDALAFDYTQLGRVKLRVPVGYLEEKGKELLRCYRNIVISSKTSWQVHSQNFHLGGAQASRPCCQMLTPCCQPVQTHWGPTAGYVPASWCTCAVLSMCRCSELIKPDLQNGSMPVLEHLTQLDTVKESEIDVISLAPNLRTLRAGTDLKGLPAIIQTLPLEHLWLQISTCLYVDIFRNCINTTRLTSIVLELPIAQNSLEELCKCCPLLTKFCFMCSEVTTLRCLADLHNLKILEMDLPHGSMALSSDFFLPSVEKLGLVCAKLDFGGSMRFPNVHYLKVESVKETAAKISATFPVVNTLVVSGCDIPVLKDLSSGLVQLRELILCEMHLEDEIELSFTNVHQLTLIDAEVRADLFPRLQLLNLSGIDAICTNTENLPSTCSIKEIPYEEPYYFLKK